MYRAFHELELTQTQDMILSSTVTNVAVSGGLGASKTGTAARYALLKMGLQPGCRLCLAAKRHQQLVEADLYMLQELLTKFGIRRHYDANRHILRFSNQSQLLLQSFENQLGVEKGPEYDEVLADEHDLLTDRRQIDNLIGRARGKLGTCQFRTFGNSVPQSHWVAQDYKIRPLPNHKLFQIPTHANRRFLPRGYIEKLEQRYPPGTVGHRRWLLGEVGLPLEGAVFSEFQIDRDSIEHTDAIDSAPRHYGLFLHDGKPTTLIEVAQLANDKLVVTRELSLPNADPKKIIRKVNEVVGDSPVYSDPDSPLFDEFSGPIKLAPVTYAPESGVKAIRERLASDGLLLLKRDGRFVTPILSGEFEQHSYGADMQPEDKVNQALTAMTHVIMVIDRGPSALEYENLGEFLAQ